MEIVRWSQRTAKVVDDEMACVLKATNLTKIYGGYRGTVAVKAIDSFNLTVAAGDFTGIMGPSGSGKSTLLQLLGGIDTPTSGEVLLMEQPLSALKGSRLADFRRRNLGFIFQEYNLLDSLTIRENIILPLALENRPVQEIDHKVEQLAGRFGLTAALNRFPFEVSGGQRQRTAAARALIHAPALVLADEPTGNLDSKSAKVLMESLLAMNQQDQATILMVTHDPACASFCERIIFIKDGSLLTDIRRGTDRRQFYREILDVLSAMGGEPHDLVLDRL